MKPTEILKNEHRVIEQVLMVLEKMVDCIHQEKKLDEESARKAIDFVRNFADRCHHGKEETHLFSWMEAHGFPREGGPTGVMLHEHELGRSYVRGMLEALDQFHNGKSDSMNEFAQHAFSYIQLLRDHIQKEDQCLFPMADQAMSEEDQRSLQSLFVQVEQEEMGKGTHERYLQIAHDLAVQYEVPQTNIDLQSILSGCKH